MTARGLALAAAALAVAAAVLLWLLHMQAPEPEHATSLRDAAPAPVHAQVPPTLAAAADAAILSPEETASIHGRLTEHGKPVAGFEVSFRAYYAAAVTDGAGEFRIAGVPPGTHVVVAEDRKTGRRASQEVRLFAGDDPEVDLDLVQTGRLHIEVVDAAGAPVASANVTVTGDAAAWSYFSTARMQTDERGTIDRLGLTTGPVAVSATAAGTTITDNVLFAGGEQTARLTLPARARLSIAGRAVDDRGAPVAGAKIWVGNSWNDAIESDHDGRFRFDGLLEGSYNVGARVGEVRTSSTRVTAGTLDVTLVIPRVGAIEGTAEGFGDLANISIQGDGYEAATFAKASKLIRRELPPGHYRVVAAGPLSGAVGSTEIDIRADETTTVELRPGPTGGVHVAVLRFPEATPVPNVECYAVGAPTGAPGTRSDAAGELTLDHLAPGSQKVLCRGELIGDGVAQVQAGQTVALRVWITGEQHAADEKRLGAHLDVATQTFTQVDPDGAATAAGIAAGDRLVAVEGTAVTAENAAAARAFLLAHTSPYRVRVRSKGATYAVDLTVTPR